MPNGLFYRFQATIFVFSKISSSFTSFLNLQYLSEKMKSLYSTIFALILPLSVVFSQDLITKISGDYIQAKVIEISNTEIKYKKFDNLDGPVFVLPKSEIHMIQYENGTKDIFPNQISLLKHQLIKQMMNSIFGEKMMQPNTTNLIRG